MNLSNVCISIVRSLVQEYETCGHPFCPYCGLSLDDGPKHMRGCLFEKVLSATDEQWDKALEAKP